MTEPSKTLLPVRADFYRDGNGNMCWDRGQAEFVTVKEYERVCASLSEESSKLADAKAAWGVKNAEWQGVKEERTFFKRRLAEVEAYAEECAGALRHARSVLEFLAAEETRDGKRIVGYSHRAAAIERIDAALSKTARTEIGTPRAECIKECEAYLHGSGQGSICGLHKKDRDGAPAVPVLAVGKRGEWPRMAVKCHCCGEPFGGHNFASMACPKGGGKWCDVPCCTCSPGECQARHHG